MAIITDIQPQKRKKNRVNIYLDGEYAFSLADITAAYLKIGQELPEAKRQQLQHEDEYERAKDAAMRLIVQRPRSVLEVKQRLRQKDFTDQTAEVVCQRLLELELLDDAAFARYWVEQRETFKPRSPLALKQELSQKGIAREIIDEIVGEVDPESAAEAAAQQRLNQWRHLSEESFTKKMSGYLQRRGFSYDITRKITNKMWQEAASSEGD